MNAEIFWELLFTTLLSNAPQDTRNMVRHILHFNNGDYFNINISGPVDGGTDYASFVNYNQQRGPKELRNFKWVERTIEQVTQLLGGNAQYELS